MCGFFAYPTWEALSDIGVFASSTMIFSLSILVEPCLFVSSISCILIFTLPVTVLLIVFLLVTILPLSYLSDIGCKVVNLHIILSNFIVYFINILEALFRIIVLSHPVLSIFMLFVLADYEMPLAYVAEILLVVS